MGVRVLYIKALSAVASFFLFVLNITKTLAATTFNPSPIFTDVTSYTINASM
ncbi:hypothetical protein CAL7716_102900 (plasmid) [Calothrix sp. PCC 7716]|nr:hypothetical protein CAL7716_102900 [Calothrix sp. PCC 7716]